MLVTITYSVLLGGPLVRIESISPEPPFIKELLNIMKESE